MYLSFMASGVVIIGGKLSANKNLVKLRLRLFDLNSPLLKSSTANVLRKVLKPSSIQPYLRSLLPTTIGNHVWPNSWSVTLNKPAPLERALQKTMDGYSIPLILLATLVAVL